MNLLQELVAHHKVMTEWRHDIHQHPETGFEEHRTSQIVAEKLAEFGLDVDRGMATTGVVGTLKSGDSGRCIALRADLDALNMQELNTFEHRSKIDGKMHGCGHDGHTVMLLGAAWYLSKSKCFDGTIHFIFQPAEEAGNGGLTMIEDGLFKKFHPETIFGMHNFPGLDLGTFATRAGPFMASMDVFEITITGIGGHGGFPDKARSPILPACAIVSALNEHVGSQIATSDDLVMSVCQIESGNAVNVIPETATIKGTVRSLSDVAQDAMEVAVPRISNGICAAYGVECAAHYIRNYPRLVNDEEQTVAAGKAASALVGFEKVDIEYTTIMASEDFAWMLQEKPGCMIFVGNGSGETGGCFVHNPHYDFNDEILPLGASYWVELVKQMLPQSE
jgi:amidohydrolase